MIFPREHADEPLRTGFLPGEHGGWEVIRVEPVEGNPDMVRVHIVVR